MLNLFKSRSLSCHAGLATITVALALATAANGASAMCIGNAPVHDAEDPVKASVKFAVGRSTAVFVGEVIALDYVPAVDERGHPAEMLVVRMLAGPWWKGDESREVALHTLTHRYPNGTASTESHEYQYEKGRTYLVYAYASRGGLHANGCSRTRPIEEAASDIAALDALKAE